jgi:hypothetical protein
MNFNRFSIVFEIILEMIFSSWAMRTGSMQETGRGISAALTSCGHCETSIFFSFSWRELITGETGH